MSKSSRKFMKAVNAHHDIDCTESAILKEQNKHSTLNETYADDMYVACKKATQRPQKLTPFTCYACLDKNEKNFDCITVRPTNTSEKFLSDSNVSIYGVYVWPDGDYYSGWWLHGKRHGHGKLVKITGETYIGWWKNGMMNGDGHFVWHNGDEYIGEFVNGLWEGKGKLFFKTKTFMGMWKRGKRHGFGIQTFADESSYEGSWCDNQYNGDGQLTYANGSEYRGFWRKGQRHGAGRFVGQNGDVYEGEWRLNKRQGHGVQVYANGNHFDGEWLNDKAHGSHGTSVFAVETFCIENQRKYRYAAGDRHVGSYAFGKRCGAGVYFHADGRVFDAIWTSNNIVTKVKYRRDKGGKEFPFLTVTDRGNAHRWSIEAVKKFISNLTPLGQNFTEGIQKFSIQGEALLSFTDEDLRDKLGVHSHGIRKRIMKEISSLIIEVEDKRLSTLVVKKLVEIYADSEEFVRTKSLLLANMGKCSHIEYVQVLKVWRVDNTILNENFRVYGNELRSSTRCALEKMCHIGFYTAKSETRVDPNTKCFSELLSFIDERNTVNHVRDRWFGDPRKGVYIARQCSRALMYLDETYCQKDFVADDHIVDKCDIAVRAEEQKLSENDAVQKLKQRVNIYEFAMVECYPGHTYRFKYYWQIAQPKKGYDSHTSMDGLEWFLLHTHQGQMRPLYKFQVLVYPTKHRNQICAIKN